MDTWVWIVLLAVALIVVAAVVWLLLQRRRTEDLRESFGPEYDRAVHEQGDRRSAESELADRRKRVERLHIRALAPEERGRFAESWRSTQARFVDDPAAAIADADHVVGAVMESRGYPVGEFEQRAADISVDHPQVVTNYRAAHRIARAQTRGEASTEDLRQAMVHYRSLFEELLETDTAERSTSGGRR